jgi:hypothetical protein
MHSQTCVWFKKGVWLAVTNLHVHWLLSFEFAFLFGSHLVVRYVGTRDCPMA